MARQEMYSAPALSEVVTLTADISSSDTTIPVDFPEKLPEAPNLITLGIDESTVEVVLYYDKDSSSLLDCVRGFANTAAAGWTSGTKAARAFTSYDHNAFKNNIQETLLDYSRLPGFAITSGAADDYEVTLDPAPGTIGDGFGLCLAIHETNTGASTVTINGGSPIGLKKPDGTNFAAGELVEGQLYNFRFLGTDFLAVNVGKEGSGGGGTDINGQHQVLMTYGETLEANDPVFIKTFHEPIYAYSGAAVGSGVSVSPDGNYVAFCTGASPLLRIFKRQSDDSFTEISVTSSLGGSQLLPVWSPDGTHLVVTTNASPWCQVFKRDGDTFTSLNPSAVVGGLTARPAVAFNPSGTLLVMCFVGAATRVLSRSGDTYTAVTNSIPSGFYSIAFDTTGSIFVGTKNTSAFATFYSVQGTTFTSMTSPLDTQPQAATFICTFSPDGNYFALACGYTPVLWVYKIVSPTQWTRCSVFYVPPNNSQQYYQTMCFSADSQILYYATGFSNISTTDRLLAFVVDNTNVYPYTYTDLSPYVPNNLVNGVSQTNDLLAVVGQNSDYSFSLRIFKKYKAAFKSTYANRLNAEAAGYTLSAGTKGQVKSIMQITN